MKNSWFRFSIFPLILLLCLVFSCEQQGEKTETEKKAEHDIQVEKIPVVIMDALKAKFTKAKIHKWTMEKEGEILIYDIEFEQFGLKFEVDIKEDGTIHNWEKEIKAKTFPEAVIKSVVGKYPKATLREIMEINAVKDGKDTLEGYEIVLRTADNKEVEVMVAPDGKILEDPGEEQKEEP